MSRKSTKQICEENILREFNETLDSLPDPRRRQGQRYPLKSVVMISLMAMVCGCDDAESMQHWGEANKKWLSEFLRLPYGPPTQDVFLNVFAALDPAAFSSVFVSWMKVVGTRLSLVAKHIAIDGKTSRRCFDRDENGKKVCSLHTVSAWMGEEGLVLGQQKTLEKSNEITAIPELLKLIDIRGATITIDAMGCQTEIASTIIDRRGNYLLAVKENQPTLYKDVQDAFKDSRDTSTRPMDQPAALAVESYTSTDKGHGRVEERTTHVCTDLSWLSTSSKWRGVSYIAMVQSMRTELSSNHTSTESRYYIGSGPITSAENVGNQVRRHWGVENGSHWVLDMAFREDEARHRAKNCGSNFTTLRHFALNLLKMDKSKKLGVANKRKLAGWNRKYLINVLTGALT